MVWPQKIRKSVVWRSSRPNAALSHWRSALTNVMAEIGQPKARAAMRTRSSSVVSDAVSSSASERKACRRDHSSAGALTAVKGCLGIERKEYPARGCDGRMGFIAPRPWPHCASSTVRFLVRYSRKKTGSWREPCGFAPKCHFRAVQPLQSSSAGSAWNAASPWSSRVCSATTVAGPSF